MKRMSSREFFGILRHADPSVPPIITEHLDDYDEHLIHLLMSDVLRLAVLQFAAGETEASARILKAVERGLAEGDHSVVNAVVVSFVENVGFGPGESPEFIASWPPLLLAELQAQQ